MQVTKVKTKPNTAVPYGGQIKWQRVTRLILTLAAAALWIAGAATEDQRVWLCLLSLACGSFEILWGAITELQQRKRWGYLLCALSLVISFCVGYHCTAAVSALILHLGYWICSALKRAAQRDTDYFDGLLHLRGRVREKEGYVFREADSLAKGTVVEVFPGETVPADGVVVSVGEAILDYSTWLHRQKTVQVSQGSVVYCGALNHGQPIAVRVSAAGKYTFAQTMKKGILAAVKQKSTLQTVLGKILPLLTLLFSLIAVLVGLFVPLFGGDSWENGLIAAAGILMIAGVRDILESVDLAFYVGVAAMCRRGVLFKSCRQVMLLRRITDMIFSKTGTLTERELRVDEIVPHNQFTKHQLLGLAATAEQISDHLIAAAIMKEAGDIALPKPKHQLVIAGEGVCVNVGGRRIYVGNELLMRRAGVEVLPYHGLGIICFVAVEETYVGCIILHDPIKSGATKTLNGLFAYGIRSIDLVTGDKENNAEALGMALGVHRIFAGLSKKEKEKVVRRNIRKGKYGGRIAFVGEEHDEECLRAADISFAMNTIEQKLTGTAGDIAVISDDPLGVLYSFRLSFKLRNIFTVLLIFELAIKLVMMIFFCMGWFPLWAAALAESGLRMFAVRLAQSCRKVSR